MADLERQLRALGRGGSTIRRSQTSGRRCAIACPSNPAANRGAARPRAMRIIVIACLVALCARGATALALSGPRHAMPYVTCSTSEGVTIQTTATAPRAEPRDAPAGRARRYSPRPANGLGFEPLVPSALGPPDRITASTGSVPWRRTRALLPSPRRQLPARRTTGVGLLVSELRGGIRGGVPAEGRPRGDQGRSAAGRRAAAPHGSPARRTSSFTATRRAGSPRTTSRSPRT